MAILNNANAISAGGYNLDRSLRFRSSASASLSRTPASATNQQKWTWSGWVKRGSLSSTFGLFGAKQDASNFFQFYFTSGDVISIASSATSINTTQVFRDPSAWYHIVLAVDTTQATASNRVILYVNGSQVTAFSTATYPTQNSTYVINGTTAQHQIAQITASASATVYPFDGYMAEINFIDGQQLTPSSFGSTNSTTGVWQPAKYTGTYGTNGFYLPFTDNSGATSTTIGKDFSGNSNNWTPNNISVTAGTTYDSMTDVPTLTSATAANYAVLNPIDKGTNATVSEANLKVSTSTTHTAIRGTFALPTSGKWYWESTIGSTTSNTASLAVGICTASTSINTYPWNTTGTYSMTLYSAMQIVSNGSIIYDAGSGASAGTVFGIAWDADNNKLYIGVANTFYSSAGAGTGNPSTGTNPTLTPTSGIEYYPYFQLYNQAHQANFGQRPFTYTPPTGYVALNTYNLPTPTIIQGNRYMDATLYTGTGTALNVVNASQFKPDFVWIKGRSSAYNHGLFDSVRGALKIIQSNSTAAEVTETAGTSLTGFNSNGFALGTNGGTVSTNVSGQTFVGWQWQAGQGTTSSNTSGSITSTVSVNATAGFSVVTYTGTGANATVGHGLGVAPSMIIFKQRNAVRGWPVYHKSLGASTTIYFNVTNASNADSTIFNATSPTSSVFSLGASSDTNNGNVVAYCWAEIAGFSKAFSYTGNGSSDGVFVYLGFRPKYVMIKNSGGGATSSLQGWIMIDTSRNPYNLTADALFANNSNASNSGTSYGIDMLSNGFKTRGTDGSINESSATYIGIAFAESPFKSALAR